MDNQEQTEETIPDSIVCPICDRKLSHRFSDRYRHHYRCWCGFHQKIRKEGNNYQPCWDGNSDYGPEVRKAIVREFHRHKIGVTSCERDTSSASPFVA